ncbi:hypothetical protein GURASL_10990 [Geotalea uraniireducens]|uniref:Anti-sigma factor antagonist n=1 Tax=Geotalea uraniireducens TaxID=351604 RepID=A0ABN6VTM7_9BACT|nr:anti-sigma factor antagonist [Geotalea uraniireducens]BDV42176.1 hypothetical protein GURASL_10990 [Geotalea uraniireducens]
MNIEIDMKDGRAVAVICGEIDGKTAPQAQAQLLPVFERTGKLLLEMSGVSYLSSAGLRTLLLLYRQATARSGKVALVGLSEEIRDTMAMTGFLNFFITADSLEAGLKALD